MDYAYLLTGELDTIKQGATVLADYGYDNLGNRTGVTFEGGTAQAFGYDPVSRLASLTNDLSGTTNDLSVTFAYNPASQIIQTVRTGDAYAFTGHVAQNTAGVANGLNQLTSVGGTAASYDAKGNLTTDPTSAKTYTYSSENLLTTGSGSVTAAYDPITRLSQIVGAAATKFAYDGVDSLAEYDGLGALQRRFVFDPTTGQPVVQYEGTGVAATDRRYLSQDERGSVISLTDSAGALIGINSYDEYGIPGAANVGRFQYTGQAWLPELGLYYYKARMYSPKLGRFAQTDPIGYADSPNLYNYVLGDPVNLVDPLGLGIRRVFVGKKCVAVGEGRQNCSPIYDFIQTPDVPSLRNNPRTGEPGPGGSGGQPAQKKGSLIERVRVCLAKLDDDTKIALGLDAVGALASATGAKGLWEAGSFAVGMTSGMFGLALFGAEGNAAQKGAAGLSSISTAIDVAATGGHGLATRIAEALPGVGVAASGIVLAIDLKDALEKAGC